MGTWKPLGINWREVFGKMEDATPEYPSVIQALRAVLQEDFDDEGQYNRVTIQVLGTGEVAYRLHPRDGSDYVGGVTTIS